MNRSGFALSKWAAAMWLSCVNLLIVSSVSAQSVIRVPSDQPTIQSGINAANSGDTVLVAPGTYVEHINFSGKSIQVTSSGGPSVTTIDGGANGTVVTINSGETANAMLSGFTITNGLQNGLGGGGILISGASPTITGNVITGNHAAIGIGIYVNGGSPSIKNNTITANNQTGAGDGGEGGGGILVDGSDSSPASPQIIGNTITNNSVAAGGNGGGISLAYFSSPLIQGNLIQGNSAYNNGGGMSVQSYNSPVVVENLIVNNSSGTGGGVWVSPSSSSSQQTFLNNTIAGNTASDNTSGIYSVGFGQFAAFTNNIVVAATGQVAVTCSSLYSSISPIFSYNDAFSSSRQNWADICDTTSQPGNISADPQFIGASTDFHLQWGSPAVDAGNNFAPNLPVIDFDGNPRVVDGNGDGTAVVDLGAYELSPTTISLSASSLTFGPQPPGSTSTAQTVTLTNTGNQKLLFAIAVDANFAQTNNCGASLAAGSTCSIDVVFSPMTTGNITGNLTLRDTASGSPHTLSLAGEGGAPMASLAPSSLNFGSQLVATTSASQSATLSNTGTTQLTIYGITASGNFAQTNNCGSILNAGANCVINVTFTPTATATQSGSVNVADNASGSPQILSLTGTGTAPVASFSPTSLSFGPQAVTSISAPQAIILRNVGTASMTINSIFTTGDFTFSSGCGTSLTAGASCAINVSFAPTTSGSRSGLLVVSESADASPMNFGLSGTGVDFLVNVTPGSATIDRGNSYMFSAGVTPVGGTFTNSVSLSCLGLPSAASCSFSSQKVTPGSSGVSSAMTVTTNRTATSLGTFTLTVTGVSGGLTHSIQVQLTIKKH